MSREIDGQSKRVLRHEEIHCFVVKVMFLINLCRFDGVPTEILKWIVNFSTRTRCLQFWNPYDSFTLVI